MFLESLSRDECSSPCGDSKRRNERFHLHVGASAGGALGHSLEVAILLLISDNRRRCATREHPLTDCISLAISRGNDDCNCQVIIIADVIDLLQFRGTRARYLRRRWLAPGAINLRRSRAIGCTVWYVGRLFHQR